MAHLVGNGCVLLLAALGACALPIELPPDFVHLRDAGDFRAVTGDDARVWVREFHDPNEAGLAFWAQALEHEFTAARGYDLVAKGEVANRAGEPGRWFECAANVRGERIGYLVAVWADDDLMVVEFAARDEVFRARVESVRAALATVRD